MKEEILSNLNNPAELEKLYRADKQGFERQFKTLYPEMKDNTLAGYWYERLNFTRDDLSWGTGKDLIIIIIACLFAGFIAKLPAILSLNDEFFYPRNVGFILFPLLTAYFAWKNNLSNAKIGILTGAVLAAVLYINMLPNSQESDTLVLACIHMLLFLWAVLGFAFVGKNDKTSEARLDFLKFNGDLVVITTLILIAGGILTGITIGLFSITGFDIENFYFENIVIFLVPSAPILGTYLIRTNPQLVGKVSPVIAKIFSPLVLVMLITYLSAMIFSGKDPYNDRDFLVIFNALLIGVMAIIFFSVAESAKNNTNHMQIWILLLLSIVTVIVNGIAVSAILFRISEWGITPNRVAVLGGNLLILINLLFVTVQLFRVISKKSNVSIVGNAITQYLPVYFIWAAIVTFIFPFLFGFR